MQRFSILLSITLFTIASCSKKLDLQALSFDASTDKTTYTTSDTVQFNFAGNPDVISFYSGEIGHRYQYRNRVSDTSSNLQLKFSTATTTATNGTLSLLVSSDFNGVKDSANIYNATWTDITSRATLATGTTTVASGTVSLADFAQKQKPVYIAFKYAANAAAIQRKWTITSLSLSHVLTDTSYTITDLTLTTPSSFPAYTASPGWVSANIKNAAIAWSPTSSISTTTSLVFTGATTATAAVATESWIIAGPIDLSRVLPDGGVAVKDITQLISSYRYQYTKKGVYNAVFLGSNTNKDKLDSLTKQINLTIQ